MKTLQLTESSLEKLDRIARELETAHAEADLKCALGARNSAVCTPCKGGCGSLSSLIGITELGASVFEAN